MLTDMPAPDAPEPDPGAENDPEARAELMENIYLMYQLQPRLGMDAETRRQKAAFMRYECKRLGVKIPSHIATLHPKVEAHPDPKRPGEFTFTYGDPVDSPDGSGPLFPDEDFSDLRDADGDEDMPQSQEQAATPEEVAEHAQAKLAEIGRWERKVTKAMKAGKRANVPFASEVLSSAMYSIVSERLMIAATPSMAKSVFQEARRLVS